MRLRFVPVLALAIAAAPAAHADIIFDSQQGAYASADGAADGVSAMADSFKVTGAFKVVSVSLDLLSTSVNSSSASIWLVPDNGSGSPTFTQSGNTFTGFGPNAVELGTVLDSQLTSTPSLFTVPVGASVPATTGGEYWIGVEVGSSTIQWAFNYSSPLNVGVVGQSSFYFNTGDGGPVGIGITVPNNDPYGPYAMIVSTPEPMSLALLGVGMAGLGFVRRRSAKSK